MTVVLVPENMDLQPLPGEKFSFEVALRLLKLGYKLKRDGWLGYIYLFEGQAILYDIDDSLWQPYQEDIIGLDWQIAKD